MQKGGISDRKSTKEEKIEKVCSFLFEPLKKKLGFFLWKCSSRNGQEKTTSLTRSHKKEADDDDDGISLFEKVNGRFFDETI